MFISDKLIITNNIENTVMYSPFFISKWWSFRNPCIHSQDCDDPGEADAPVDYCLVLRKWMDINPAFEFRCFVKNKELVG